MAVLCSFKPKFFEVKITLFCVFIAIFECKQNLVISEKTLMYLNLSMWKR